MTAQARLQRGVRGPSEPLIWTLYAAMGKQGSRIYSATQWIVPPFMTCAANVQFPPFM